MSPRFTLGLVLIAVLVHLLIAHFEFPFIWIASLTVLGATLFSDLQATLLLLCVVVLTGVSISAGVYIYAAKHTEAGAGAAFLSLFLVHALTLYTGASVNALRLSRRELESSLAKARQASTAKSQFLVNDVLDLSKIEPGD